ncbi:hypothetical protein ABIB62_003264 [Mucilaginibacter sp. UYP25]|uniref:hypothetical protein n=1 Tax=unclassified Mucilaginibacter TaxID=2617802 RepID=UPI0033994E44
MITTKEERAESFKELKRFKEQASKWSETGSNYDIHYKVIVKYGKIETSGSALLSFDQFQGQHTGIVKAKIIYNKPVILDLKEDFSVVYDKFYFLEGRLIITGKSKNKVFQIEACEEDNNSPYD